ncbi:Hypothetical_protein [Hexamita inflata]|uniref:Hypothetical_protein n=1 Tax=Hexamita inflata TaxID=28002 RepID=A0ABP1HBH0_9EUKA
MLLAVILRYFRALFCLPFNFVHYTNLHTKHEHACCPKSCSDMGSNMITNIRQNMQPSLTTIKPTHKSALQIPAQVRRIACRAHLQATCIQAFGNIKQFVRSIYRTCFFKVYSVQCRFYSQCIIQQLNNKFTSMSKQNNVKMFEVIRNENSKVARFDIWPHRI